MRAIRHASHELPVARWAILVGVAVVGSLFFGASLALVLPHWTFSGAALWLSLSAGLAWCVFIPALTVGGRLGVAESIDASLQTMAAGEVVLTAGTLANLLLARTGGFAHAAPINALIVAISNLAMATVLVRILRDRVPARRAVLLWMLFLNGSGALFFAVLHGFFRLS